MLDNLIISESVCVYIYIYYMANISCPCDGNVQYFLVSTL